METKEIYEIPLRDIRVSDFNVRMTRRNVRIGELTASIRKYGLLQPIILRGSYGNPPYELIVGQRRYLAHKKLRKKSIQSTFFGKLDDVRAKILSLTENMHRIELNNADKAEAITALYKEYGGDDRNVARELGLSLRTVRDYIRIEEEATPEAKEALKRKVISKADLKRVIDAAQGDPNKINELLELMPKLSRYEKPRAVEYAKDNPEASADEIIEEGMKPRLERTVILNLPKEVSAALGRAEKELSMDAEEVAARALSEWLRDNGFLRQ